MKNRIWKDLLVFIAAVVGALLFLSVMLGGIQVPFANVFMMAFFIGFAVIAAYEAGKREGSERLDSEQT